VTTPAALPVVAAGMARDDEPEQAATKPVARITAPSNPFCRNQATLPNQAIVKAPAFRRQPPPGRPDDAIRWYSLAAAASTTDEQA
jgi:hypothetical protein